MLNSQLNVQPNGTPTPRGLIDCRCRRQAMSGAAAHAVSSSSVNSLLEPPTGGVGQGRHVTLRQVGRYQALYRRSRLNAVATQLLAYRQTSSLYSWPLDHTLPSRCRLGRLICSFRRPASAFCCQQQQQQQQQIRRSAASDQRRYGLDTCGSAKSRSQSVKPHFHERSRIGDDSCLKSTDALQPLLIC